jgi:hypothetical protein
MRAQALVRRLPVGEKVVQAILGLVRSGRPDDSASENVRNFVAWGPSPRASQAFMLAIRARALLEGRFAPSIDDVIALAHAILRHRRCSFSARRGRDNCAGDRRPLPSLSLIPLPTGGKSAQRMASRHIAPFDSRQPERWDRPREKPERPGWRAALGGSWSCAGTGCPGARTAQGHGETFQKFPRLSREGLIPSIGLIGQSQHLFCGRGGGGRNRGSGACVASMVLLRSRRTGKWEAAPLALASLLTPAASIGLLGTGAPPSRHQKLRSVDGPPARRSEPEEADLPPELHIKRLADGLIGFQLLDATDPP